MQKGTEAEGKGYTAMFALLQEAADTNRAQARFTQEDPAVCSPHHRGWAEVVLALLLVGQKWCRLGARSSVQIAVLSSSFHIGDARSFF